MFDGLGVPEDDAVGVGEGVRDGVLEGEEVGDGVGVVDGLAVIPATGNECTSVTSPVPNCPLSPRPQHFTSFEIVTTQPWSPRDPAIWSTFVATGAASDAGVFSVLSTTPSPNCP